MACCHFWYNRGNNLDFKVLSSRGIALLKTPVLLVPSKVLCFQMRGIAALLSSFDSCSMAVA